jgi:hypothetical protein
VATLSERDLEGELHRIYDECKKFGYQASRFYQMITPDCQKYLGGVAAVRKLLDAPTSGLLRLIDEGRIDLAIEHLVLSPKWSHLFKSWDQKKARENLRYANALHRTKNQIIPK